MRPLLAALRELAGLFVEDGWLAVSVILVVALATAIARALGAGLAAGAVLLLGCLIALLANVLRAARR